MMLKELGAITILLDVDRCKLFLLYHCCLFVLQNFILCSHPSICRWATNDKACVKWYFQVSKHNET